MKHDIPFALLCDYADGRCSGADKEKVEAHVAHCPACRRHCSQLRNAARAMEHFEGVEASPDYDRVFEGKLRERIARKKENRPAAILDDLLEKMRDIAVMPRLAVVPVAVAACGAVFLYTVLQFVLVESPQVILVQGKASIYSARQKGLVSDVANYRIAKGDIISVSRGSFVDIRDRDRFTLRIKEDARVSVARLLPKFVKGTTEYRVEKGRMLALIQPAFKGSRFIVATPEARAKALGTEFFVDVSSGPASLSTFGVFTGKVQVVSHFRPSDRARQRVVVDAGEATEVFRGKTPISPRQLVEREWQEMAEFYQIGKKAQVALLISNGKHRAHELLRPCALFISDTEPRTIGESLEKTIRVFDEAIKTKDTQRQLEGVRMIEEVMQKYPNPDYDPQLLLFTGSYYNYLGMPHEAIERFLKVADNYPGSPFASMALYATGIVYEEKLHDTTKAAYYYDLVRKSYPHSPESESLTKK